MNIAALLLRYRKPLLYGLAGLIVVAGLLAYRHSLIKAGEATGRAEVQVLWDADIKARDKVAADAIAAARHAEAAARANNAEVEREYIQKLAAADSERESIYRLLQQARNQVPSGGTCQAADSSVTDPASQASVSDRIDRAVAGAVSEALMNAEQLDALIAVVTAQM